ncbi:MAG: bifunctional [glutamine synthetase] adenylyltransferase/[glutamine synthetase]-adenylyl-L-tyrosine phosphorylase [Rhodospirillaceae bacterium]
MSKSSLLAHTNILGLPVPINSSMRERLLVKWATEAKPKIQFEEDHIIGFGSDITLSDLLIRLFSHSPFLSNAAINHPLCINRILDLGPDQAWLRFITDLENELNAYPGNITSLMAYLRTQKTMAALHIGICDILTIWDLQDVTKALSQFADICVSNTLNFLLLLEQGNGNIGLTMPLPTSAESGIFVLALGKLGAGELNYSSDIDLVVFYDLDGVPYQGEKSIQEFVVKLTKALIKILDERTADGYVFRTDLRLRPDPSSTSIAVSTEAAEIYYESLGQNWERSAYIKARVIAGDKTAGERFLDQLKPFIWRKSLDFYAIQDIHSIKRQIYATKGGERIDILGHNIKLGRGGIREIEFYVQIQQLIWGGRLQEVRCSRTLDGLEALRVCNLIELEPAQQLSEAYIFLRNLEHRLQMLNDEQTQTLPKEKEKAESFAAFSGFRNFDDFAKYLKHHMQNVEHHYAELFEETPSLTIDGNLVFTGTDHDPDTLETLDKLGFKNSEAVSQIVRSWHHGRHRATKSTRARQILTEIIPSIISAFSKTSQPDRALIKFDQFLEKLPSGVQLFSIFFANPEVLDLVAEIMGDAPRLADYLTASSSRLEYVLDPEFYDVLPSRSELGLDIESFLNSVSDFEQKLDICRRWTNDMRFRVGIQVLRGTLSPMNGAIVLSNIAEATINSLTPHVLSEFESKFGTIENGEIAIIAYGKLASMELTPTSDLDLVFLYECPNESVSKKGERTLPASSYYTRLVQRILSSLSVQTSEGQLYEIDVRLRPSGEQGPLASSTEAFKKYQLHDAWTWEHLALTKTRLIYGSSHIREKFEATKNLALSGKQDTSTRAQEILNIRNRLQEKYTYQGAWDIKHMPGGLMDTEFIIQFSVLENYEALADSELTGTLQAISALEKHGFLDNKAAKTLSQAIKLWSTVLWLLRLTLSSTSSPSDMPLGLQSRLLKETDQASMEDLENFIDLTSKDVLAIFNNVFFIKETRSSENE